MSVLINTPLFGILLTLVAFEIGVFVSKKWKYAILNPILIANVLIVGFLLSTGISLETYNIGGNYISVFLSPATVILAVPLYKQISKLKSYWKPSWRASPSVASPPSHASYPSANCSG